MHSRILVPSSLLALKIQLEDRDHLIVSDLFEQGFENRYVVEGDREKITFSVYSHDEIRQSERSFNSFFSFISKSELAIFYLLMKTVHIIHNHILKPFCP
jgi:hypothetical protein